MNKYLWPLFGFIALVILLAVGLSLNPRELPSPLVGKPAPFFNLPLIGLNYKEIRGDGSFDLDKLKPAAEQALGLQRARQWLSQHGDPYRLSVLDLDGRVGIDYGVYGVPETYVIDQTGSIRLKHTGPITPEVLEKKILPLIAKLKQG